MNNMTSKYTKRAKEIIESNHLTTCLANVILRILKTKI